MKALPPSVKYICHIGAGYDSIDAVSCAKQGIDCAAFVMNMRDRIFRNCSL